MRRPDPDRLPPGAGGGARSPLRRGWALLVLASFLPMLPGCSSEQGSANGGRGAPSGREGGTRRGGPPGGAPGGFGEATPAVPVEARTVERRDISFYIESNGTLEAENDVEIVARTSGPVVELKVEEGDAVRRGQLLARIDESEIRAQLAIARVALEEAQQAYDRALRLRESQLISPEDFDVAETRFETAQAQVDATQLQLDYTQIRAPFDGLIIERHVQFAQQVAVGAPLFRISDFDPLLCPIQVPERELARLHLDQPAYLTVEAWPGERFAARVLRIRPVVEAATGTVKVTLEVEARGKLRPGMFARVYVQTETHENALVIPKTALSLESIGDTVFVVADGVADRREVEVGFTEGDLVEITRGLMDGERVVTVGQDGLSDGTPIQVVAGDQAAAETGEVARSTGSPGEGGETTMGGPGPRGAGGFPDFDPSQMTPERLEMIKERMRQRGLSEEEIEERLKRMREAAGAGSS